MASGESSHNWEHLEIKKLEQKRHNTSSILEHKWHNTTSPLEEKWHKNIDYIIGIMLLVFQGGSSITQFVFQGEAVLNQ